MEMFDQPVQLKRSRGLATIILNRPEKLNALNQDLIVSLRQTLEAVASDNNIRVVCLTGSGRAFCAGQDLTERDPRIHKHPFDLEAIQKSMYHPVIRLMTEMPKPVVAKVNGLAAGAGASLVMASDIVIAVSSAVFSFSFVSVGLSVDAGGGWTLSQALGPARARAILMLGEEISASKAEALGLIYRCVEDKEMDDSVDIVLDKLLSSPSSALASIKQTIRAAQTEQEFEDYLQQEAKLQGKAGRSSDYAEGVLAFLEKRKPNFR